MTALVLAMGIALSPAAAVPGPADVANTAATAGATAAAGVAAAAGESDQTAAQIANSATDIVADAPDAPTSASVVAAAIAPTPVAATTAPTVVPTAAADASTSADAPASAARPTIVPALTLGLARTPETLTVTMAEDAYRDQRSVWQTGLRLGISYRLPTPWLGSGHLRGHTGVALDVVLTDGRFPVGLVQEGLWEQPLAGSLAFVAGANTAVHLDLGNPGLAHLDLGVPVGLRWGAVELLYMPRVGIPLAAARHNILGGTRERRTGAGLALLHVFVRVHLGGPP